jgi:3-phytase/alkaline phosphatase D
MHAHARNRLGLIVTLALTLLMLLPAAASPTPGIAEAQTVVDLEFVGEVTFAPDYEYGGTVVGGLSSITYDEQHGVFHTLSDDQGSLGPVRFYTVAIDLDDGFLDDGDISFVDVTTLYESKKTPFEVSGVDPEGFTLGRNGFFFMSTEGPTFTDPDPDPAIYRYNKNGRVTAMLPVPHKYLPNGDTGVRTNLGFESLAVTPDGRKLVTAGEAALAQDGPAPGFGQDSLARILVYDLRKRMPTEEFVYVTDPWAEPSAIFGVNGVVELLPIDDVGTMLAMERSFSVGGVLGGGTGNVVVIYEISTAGASDVLTIDDLYDESTNTPVSFTPVSKRLVFEFDSLGRPIDNIEGMTFGPELPDGRRSIVIVSDDNFGAAQFTQFIVLAADIRPAG